VIHVALLLTLLFALSARAECPPDRPVERQLTEMATTMSCNAVLPIPVMRCEAAIGDVQMCHMENTISTCSPMFNTIKYCVTREEAETIKDKP
jgi:hypothetical protein